MSEATPTPPRKPVELVESEGAIVYLEIDGHRVAATGSTALVGIRYRDDGAADFLRESAARLGFPLYHDDQTGTDYVDSRLLDGLPDFANAVALAVRAMRAFHVTGGDPAAIGAIMGIQ
jgi:hypothetical protein